jgi:toxin ParE1/3/4
MSHRVVLSEEAEQDIAAALGYLVPKAGERVARDYIDQIIAYCASFATFPERGTRRDDLLPGLRVVGYHRKASIAFSIEGDTVTIVRIFFRGQDIALAKDD